MTFPQPLESMILLRSKAQDIKKLTVLCGAYMRHNMRGSWNWDWNDAYDDHEEENEGGESEIRQDEL